MLGAPSPDQLGLLDHHHGVGAARDHAAGRDRGGGAGLHLQRRRIAGGDHFGIEPENFRLAVAGADGIGRTQGEAVHVGAVEGRRIDRRHHVVREHACERERQRHGLGRERRKIEMPLEAQARLIRRHHVEELLLARGRAHARKQFGLDVRPRLAGLTHVTILMATA